MAVEIRNATPLNKILLEQLERPEYVPRSSPGAPMFVAVHERSSYVPRGRKHGKRLAAERKKLGDVHKCIARVIHSNTYILCRSK